MNNWLRFGALIIGVIGAICFYFTLRNDSHVLYSFISAVMFIVGMLSAGSE